MINPVNYHLYAITDRTWLDPNMTLADAVSAAIAGGATLIQLREKNISAMEYIDLAMEIKPVCDRARIPLIINDDVLVANAVGAGVHLGASDGSIAAARKMLGENAIIGATAKTITQAQAAQQAGASYLGSGAVFGSTTKTDAKPMPLDTFSAICHAVSIPVVAIGGINAENALQLKGTGAAGLCAVSAIFAAADIQAAARRLHGLAEEVCL